ncbi:MAG: hypothetical protein AMJ69_11140 [Gammaproteobacteria bacterium SG8_47]|nr:MAG: hypothetical protein AMJ69_11140 [Gammaproteobacteria bacterium SG8_47]
MDLYIGNLPSDVDEQELRAFFKGCARDKSVKRYGLAMIEPDKAALKALRKFDRAKFKDSLVTVREFVHRSYSNERRSPNWRARHWHRPERRCCERRRAVRTSMEDLFDSGAAHAYNLRVIKHD